MKCYFINTSCLIMDYKNFNDIKSNSDNDYLWYFNSFIELKSKFPRWVKWQFARVEKDQYNWDLSTLSWILLWQIWPTWATGATGVTWPTWVTWPTSIDRYYPKDYIATWETMLVQQYENYCVYNPLVIDWVFVNEWTVILN